MIRSLPANDAYRNGWDALFGHGTSGGICPRCVNVGCTCTEACTVECLDAHHIEHPPACAVVPK